MAVAIDRVGSVGARSPDGWLTDDLGSAIQVFEVAISAHEEISTRLLVDEERAKASRFRQREDARRFAAVRSALREILGGYLETDPRSVKFAITSSGKPILAREHETSITFNVSHSADIALIAVAPIAHLGIDLESARQPYGLDEIVGLAFDPVEIRMLEQFECAARDAAILRGWTRKEAAAKALGSGFLVDPRHFRVPLELTGCWRIELPDGVALDLVDISTSRYVAALAADRVGSRPSVRPWRSPAPFSLS